MLYRHSSCISVGYMIYHVASSLLVSYCNDTTMYCNILWLVCVGVVMEKTGVVGGVLIYIICRYIEVRSEVMFRRFSVKKMTADNHTTISLNTIQQHPISYLDISTTCLKQHSLSLDRLLLHCCRRNLIVISCSTPMLLGSFYQLQSR